MPPDSDGSRSLHPMVGNLWVPAWAIRPGSYEALRGLTKEMPLWLAIHSRSGDHYLPCYHTLAQLGATIGVSRRTASRYLEPLRRAALVFEVDRGEESKSRRHRPPARWALDPYKEHRWFGAVEERLAQVAEEDGQSPYWLDRAVERLDTFNKRSCGLRARLESEHPDHLRSKRRKPKRENASRLAVSFLAHPPFLAHEGGLSPRSGEASENGEPPGDDGAPREPEGKTTSADRGLEQAESPSKSTDSG